VSKLLESFKPAAPARAHLLLAALMWTIVGSLLAFFGARWTMKGHAGFGPVVLAIAVVAAFLKSRYVLDKAAGRMIERIRARGDGRCIGGFLSLRTWVLVVIMAGSGRLLRGSPLPRTIIGFIYAAVGLALLLSARRLWQAWHQHGSPALR
jgi:hypothetical protein